MAEEKVVTPGKFIQIVCCSDQNASRPLVLALDTNGNIFKYEVKFRAWSAVPMATVPGTVGI